MESEEKPVTHEALQQWQAEVRGSWVEHRTTHERMEERAGRIEQRVAKVEGKLDNGIHAVMHEVQADVVQLTKNQWRIVWYVLGGMAGMGGVAALITSLVAP